MWEVWIGGCLSGSWSTKAEALGQALAALRMCSDAISIKIVSPFGRITEA